MESFGLTTQEITQLAILAVGLLGGLFLLRVLFRLTATLLRIGCIGIVFIVGVVFLLQLFNF